MSSSRLYLALIFVVSLLASLGSLYVSIYGDPIANLFANDLRNPLLGIPACVLCWYVRTMLFPVVIISLVALFGRDGYAWKTIMPFSIIGAIISLYTYGLEMNRRKKINEICGIDSGVNCGEAPLLYLGRMTLSLAGLIIFIIIFACCIGMYFSSKRGLRREEFDKKTME